MESSQTARSGCPRALGGQSKWPLAGPTSDQSPPVPWRPGICDGSCRRLHDHPSKCRDLSRRSTSNFKTAFFKKVVNSTTSFLGTFLPSAMWSRDTVEMQGFELAATLVAASDFQNFFWGPRRAPGDPPGRGKRSVFAPSLCARLAEQDPCIFTRDYDAPRPHTLQKCGDSGRRT